jgi:hypothetical protein
LALRRPYRRAQNEVRTSIISCMRSSLTSSFSITISFRPCAAKACACSIQVIQQLFGGTFFFKLLLPVLLRSFGGGALCLFVFRFNDLPSHGARLFNTNPQGKRQALEDSFAIRGWQPNRSQPYRAAASNPSSRYRFMMRGRYIVACVSCGGDRTRYISIYILMFVYILFSRHKPSLRCSPSPVIPTLFSAPDRRPITSPFPKTNRAGCPMHQTRRKGLVLILHLRKK